MEEKKELKEELTATSRAAGISGFTGDSSGSLSFPSMNKRAAAELECHLGVRPKEPILWELIHMLS